MQRESIEQVYSGLWWSVGRKSFSDMLRRIFIPVVLCILPTFLILHNNSASDWEVSKIRPNLISTKFVEASEPSCPQNNTAAGLVIHYNNSQTESEIRFLSNIDSFISVITTKEDGRVGNVLCAYSSLMVD